MAIESLDSIKVGDEIRFKTISPHDNVVWSGKVTAICGYAIARNFYDVDTYYADVKKYDNTVVDKEAAEYLIVQVKLSDSATSMVAFAKDWIDISTLEHIVTNDYYDIRIYNIDSSKVNDILNYIQTLHAGYVAEILSK